MVNSTCWKIHSKVLKCSHKLNTRDQRLVILSNMLFISICLLGASCNYQYDSKDFFPLSTSQAGDQYNYLQQVAVSPNKANVYRDAHLLTLPSEMDILFTLPTKHHPTPIPTQTLGTLTVHHVDTGTIWAPLPKHSWGGGNQADKVETFYEST